SLFFLFDSIIHFACYKKSFLDVPNLLKEVTIYVTYSNVCIHKHFYGVSYDKHSLTCTLNVIGVSESEVAFRLEIANPGHNFPSAIMEIISVSVNPVTKMRCPLPKWWVSKYKLQNGSRSSLLTPENSMKIPNKPAEMRIKVVYSDTDRNNHTNWKSYARFCYDSLMDACIDGKYRKVKVKDTGRAVQFFEIWFFKESVLGDDLNIFSWEVDNENENVVEFEIRNRGSLCCRAKMNLYDVDLKSKL
ncbi:hypothetical protein FSP39_002966, partial [Pinctada imbricata]